MIPFALFFAALAGALFNHACYVSGYWPWIVAGCVSAGFAGVCMAEWEMNR